MTVLDDIGRAVGVGDDFLDEKPAVVKVGMHRGRRYLLHAPVEMVVAVGARPPARLKLMSTLRHQSSMLISWLLHISMSFAGWPLFRRIRERDANLLVSQIS